MRYISSIALLLGGIVHLLPVPGVLGASTLTRLYGIALQDPNTAILLQHRAILFGALAVLMLSALALPQLRIAALTVALLSTGSFMVVALWVGGYNAEISRVMRVDAVVSALLFAGLLAEWFGATRHP